MIVVISCAGSKRSDRPFKDTNGTSLKFVADPRNAPKSMNVRYAHPDGESGDGISWREKLLRYNQSESKIFPLHKAFELYKHSLYGELVAAFGAKNTFILSAGWGLIRSDFLVPDYDITFSSAGVRYCKRPIKSEAFQDFCHLPKSTNGPIYFFGGKDYIPLFCSLTQHVKSKRVVYYNSKASPEAPNCVLENYGNPTHTTNWHYACARRFIETHSWQNGPP